LLKPTCSTAVLLNNTHPRVSKAVNMAHLAPLVLQLHRRINICAPRYGQISADPFPKISLQKPLIYPLSKALAKRRLLTHGRAMHRTMLRQYSITFSLKFLGSQHLVLEDEREEDHASPLAALETPRKSFLRDVPQHVRGLNSSPESVAIAPTPS